MRLISAPASVMTLVHCLLSLYQRIYEASWHVHNNEAASASGLALLLQLCLWNPTSSWSTRWEPRFGLDATFFHPEIEPDEGWLMWDHCEEICCNYFLAFTWWNFDKSSSWIVRSDCLQKSKERQVPLKILFLLWCRSIWLDWCPFHYISLFTIQYHVAKW